MSNLPVIFTWPVVLWALAVVPVLIGVYFIVLARKRRVVAGYAAWAPPRASASRWRRAMEHLPPLLMLIAVIALIGAMARPNAVLSLPSRHDAVILAIDVSGSMNATDMQPSRLAAAQNAARDFITHQPKTTEIGIVAFANTAVVVQRPTVNREDLLQALDRLQVQDGTSVGGAILVSLQSLFPKEDFDLTNQKESQNQLVGPMPAPLKTPPKAPMTPGSETSAAIVLLTDGQANAPPDPMAAAKLAADRGVRVFTVGIGTIKGEVVKGNGVSMRVQLDEETLKKIADTTRAVYYYSSTTPDLRAIYRDLNARIVTETKEIEISAFFVAAAAAAGLLGAALSLAWFHRVM